MHPAQPQPDDAQLFFNPPNSVSKLLYYFGSDSPTVFDQLVVPRHSDDLCLLRRGREAAPPPGAPPSRF